MPHHRWSNHGPYPDHTGTLQPTLKKHKARTQKWNPMTRISSPLKYKEIDQGASSTVPDMRKAYRAFPELMLCQNSPPFVLPQHLKHAFTLDLSAYRFLFCLFVCLSLPMSYGLRKESAYIIFICYLLGIYFSLWWQKTNLHSLKRNKTKQATEVGLLAGPSFVRVLSGPLSGDWPRSLYCRWLYHLPRISY